MAARADAIRFLAPPLLAAFVIACVTWTEPAELKRFADDTISFGYPTDWTASHLPGHRRMRPIVYLAKQPLHDPCTRTENSVSCTGDPVDELVPGGVLVLWTDRSMPREPEWAGTQIVVGGRPAVMLDRALITCDDIGADRGMSLVVPNSDDHSWIEMDACLRGPDVETLNAQVFAMLDSVQWLPTETLAPLESAQPDVTPHIGTEEERSDFFWNAVSGGDFHNIYASLDEIVSDSDLIVVGSITDLRFGDTVRGFEVTRATVVFNEVLKGEPQTQREGTFTLQLPPVLPSERDAVLSHVPDDAQLFFLFHAPLEADRDGVPGTAQQEELNDYVLVNGVQGVLRNIDDEARPLPGSDLTPFPSSVDGQPFSAVVAEVRNATR